MDEQKLVATIADIPEMMALLSILQEMELPNHYLAGGAITQAVWNCQLGHAPLDQIKDFDVVYFDRAADNAELHYEQQIHQIRAFDRPVDVKNQAKVHQWYGKKFGSDIAPLTETEDGIRMWLPCFAVGVRLQNDSMRVFAPFGLDDLANMIIRPNKTAMSEDNYNAMNRRYQTRWPSLVIEPWSPV
ncbi:nucleotidyltransferase family protein [Celerinatantimonas yamalensis]|uniref:Nucleotidyltransferase family protein n=1 Tax=Celerinatantimonas yamalensis TaxID=559956 RepID=A0ABW9G434_9GAMM